MNNEQEFLKWYHDRNRVKSLEDILGYSKSDLPLEVYRLEKEEMQTSLDTIPRLQDDVDIYLPYGYLYHGIRFQKKLEKLESIFKDKKILAGKYMPDIFSYSDNCNKGEYVSLLEYVDSLQEFKLFITENISLLISPKCNAYLTKYVDYNTWEQIKDKTTKNLYSYMRYEYLCKDFIPLDLVKAVGVPYKYYILTKGIEYADNILRDVKNLIDKYNLKIAIVDTSNFNRMLIEPEKEKSK